MSIFELWLWRWSIICLTWVILGTCFFVTSLQAETIRLKLAHHTFGGQGYFSELLEEALKTSGHHAQIEFLGEIPQKRAVRMLEEGKLSLIWLLQTQERDQRFIPVEVPLSNGLIAHRILLIPPTAQTQYKAIQSVEDFRQSGLVGGFGEGWFDVAVWQANQLPFLALDGDWARLYDMIARGNRGVDYFSRGVFEVLTDHRNHPELAIEKRLVLVYDRDYRFYLSQHQAQDKATLEQALAQAQKNGLMTRLIEKHWGNDLKTLAINQRLKLHLLTPP